MSPDVAAHPEALPAGRHPGLVVAVLTARRIRRAALGWGAFFGGLTALIAVDFSSAYKTASARADLVRTITPDVAQQALFGPANRIGTSGGYVAFHGVGVGAILVGSVWAFLLATRLLRGEEATGRWEVLLAGVTTRRRATVGAIFGLGVGVAVLWAVIAVATVVIGRTRDAHFTVSASLFYALAMVTPIALLLLVGALTSQLVATRRQAATMAAGVFGLWFTFRFVAYSETSLRWLRWASPLAWVDELRPLTGSRPLALVPIIALVAALVGATVYLAGARDLGRGVLPSSDRARPQLRLLNSPLGLGLRLARPTALGWAASVAALALVFGLISKSFAQATAGYSQGARQTLNTLGGQPSGPAAWLGVTFLFVAVLAALAAAGQVTSSREEEAQGRLDHLLTQPVGRVTWLAGRLAVATAALVLLGVSAGVFAWAGAAAGRSGVGFGRLLTAGVNVLPAAVFVLGVGTLAHAVAPRYASAVTYTIVAGSFLLEIVGSLLKASHWLLDLSVFHHVARAPAVHPNWTSALALAALGIIAASVGVWWFARRDLAGQ